MRKIISYLLIFTLILAVLPQITFAQENDYFYFESFETIDEGAGYGLPAGWEHKGSGMGIDYYICSDEINATHGKK